MKTVRKHDKKPTDQDEVKRGEIMTSWDETQSRAPTAVIRDFLSRSISISDVASHVWSAKLIVIATLVIGLLYGVYEAHHNGPMFMATMNVMPSLTDAESGSGGSGAMGMLASLTGSGAAGDSPVPKFTQFLATLKSVGVANALNQKYDMLCVVFRGPCDPQTHQWRKRTGTRAWFDGLLARIAGLPDPNGPRTLVDLAAFNGSIAVDKDKENGLITLSFLNSSPKFAADYLSKVVSTTNDYIREQDRTVQRAYVDYVSHRIATNTNVEQRDALDSLLLQQERKLMMTEVDVPYAATILDGPIVVPVNTVMKTVGLDGFLGILVGVALALAIRLLPSRFKIWRTPWLRS